jgi:Restriction endonuclease S subunits
MEALIGTVPDGWPEVPLHTLCELQAGPSGTSVRVTDRVAAGVPIVSPRNLRRGRIVGHEAGQIAAEAAENLNRYRLRAGDILCTRVGELGLQARATEEHEDWLFATGLVRLRPVDVTQAGYLAHYVALPTVRDWIDRHATGTAIPAISVQAFRSLPVVLPPLSVQAAIADALDTLNEKVEIHDQISRNTARLRDTLAPLLMTGAVAANRTRG